MYGSHFYPMLKTLLQINLCNSQIYIGCIIYKQLQTYMGCFTNTRWIHIQLIGPVQGGWGGGGGVLWFVCVLFCIVYLKKINKNTLKKKESCYG